MRTHFILALILTYATAIRFLRVEYSIFLRDQFLHWTTALKIVEMAELPLVGPTAAIGYLGPLYYYLLSVPAYFSKAPEAGGAWVAVFNIASVYLCYLLGREAFNEKVGLVASILYAASPHAVFSSTYIWNPNMLPLFTLTLMYSAVKVSRGHSKFLILLISSLAFLIQLHLTAVAFIPFLGIWMLLTRPKILLRFLALGTLVGALLVSPYLYHQALNQLSDLRSMWAEGMSFEPNLSIDRFLVQAIVETTAGPFEYTNLFSTVVSYFSLILFLLSLPALAYSAVRKKSTGPLMLLLWLLSVVLTLNYLYVGSVRYYNFGVPNHYVFVLYPMQYLAAGFLLSQLMAGEFHRFSPTKMGLLTIAMIGIIVSGQTLLVASYTAEYGVTSLTLKGMREIAKKIREDAGAETVSVTVLPASPGQLQGLELIMTQSGARTGTDRHYLILDRSDQDRLSPDPQVIKSSRLVADVGRYVKIYQTN